MKVNNLWPKREHLVIEDLKISKVCDTYIKIAHWLLSVSWNVRVCVGLGEAFKEDLKVDIIKYGLYGIHI